MKETGAVAENPGYAVIFQAVVAKPEKGMHAVTPPLAASRTAKVAFCVFHELPQAMALNLSAALHLRRNLAAYPTSDRAVQRGPAMSVAV